MDQFLDRYIFPYTSKYFGWAQKTADGLIVYTRREEKLNTVSHALGVLIGLGMIAASACHARTELGLAGGVIFGVTLTILYLVSSIYHGTPLAHTQDKKLLRLLDHCSIFVLAAGTCTPFILCLIGGSGDATEWAFYAVIWLVALGGITLLCIDLKKYKSVSIALYIFLGVLLVSRMDAFLAFLGQTGAWLLLTGGGVYLLGLLFYGLGSKHEWMHAVFHFLCLLGSLLHCACVYLYVM